MPAPQIQRNVIPSPSKSYSFYEIPDHRPAILDFIFGDPRRTFATSCMVGGEDKRTNNRRMIPPPPPQKKKQKQKKNNAANKRVQCGIAILTRFLQDEVTTSIATSDLPGWDSCPGWYPPQSRGSAGVHVRFVRTNS